MEILPSSDVSSGRFGIKRRLHKTLLARALKPLVISC